MSQEKPERIVEGITEENQAGFIKKRPKTIRNRGKNVALTLQKDAQNKMDLFYPDELKIPYYLGYNFPIPPVCAKMVSFDIEHDTGYKLTDLELRENKMLHYTNPLVTMNMVEDQVYTAKPRKSMKLTENETELANLCLNYTTKEESDSEDSSNPSPYNFAPLFHKIKGKPYKKQISSPKINLKKEENQMAKKASESKLVDTKPSKPNPPICEKKVSSFEPNIDETEFMMAGTALEPRQVRKLCERIDESFDYIKKVKIGMKKPGSNGKVTAVKCHKLFPDFENLMQTYYITSYYDKIGMEFLENQGNMTHMLKLNSEKEVECFKYKQKLSTNIIKPPCQYTFNDDFRVTTQVKDREKECYLVKTETEGQMRILFVDTKLNLAKSKKGPSSFGTMMTNSKMNNISFVPHQYGGNPYSAPPGELATDIGTNNKRVKKEMIKQEEGNFMLETMANSDKKDNEPSDRLLRIRLRPLNQHELDIRTKYFTKIDPPIELDEEKVKEERAELGKKIKPKKVLSPKLTDKLDVEKMYPRQPKKVFETKTKTSSKQAQRQKIKVDMKEICKKGNRKKKIEDSSEDEYEPSTLVKSEFQGKDDVIRQLKSEGPTEPNNPDEDDEVDNEDENEDSEFADLF
ncbi:unnamed protein product [Moneuplotes crassus]|uniref:Uncharacterized protein n=1 Tax=Euplotes crassus TaxID=5936 RepID=A0AAD1U221_EUPCR|nr:unnamed protein product [Moneuplotes crassus]